MSFLSTKILFVVALAASVVSQDAKGIVFPATGNGSESSNKMEAFPRADTTHPSEPYLRPLTPSNYLPAPPRTFVSHRSELPYVYEHPNFAYPIAHSIDYSVGPSSKHLVIVSFIGLLLLFAIIQNTMASVKRRDVLTDVLSARDKRDLYAAYDFESANAEQKEVLADDARVRCIQRTVCLENRKLTRTFGAVGKVLAKYLTRSVGKSLKSTSGWDRLVQDAGEAGIREEDCDVLYRDCEEQTSSEASSDARDESETREE
ncbi:uncharacterized protein LOC143359477 [Halictus rubicundus]|uniref:uncharacterized protein LOC143359477 n=1 Tax=Halictus rubicundus TaxID=77578 RepID=UPI004036AC58